MGGGWIALRAGLRGGVVLAGDISSADWPGERENAGKREQQGHITAQTG